MMNSMRKLLVWLLPLVALGVACNIAGLAPTEIAESGGADAEVAGVATTAPANDLVPTPIPAPTLPPIVQTSGDADQIFGTNLLIELYRTVSPGVVSIQVFSGFGGGQGSGFVYDAQGHIVTNEHVIEGAERIEVAFNDGTKAYAELVGVDITADLAVIKVDVPAERLTPLVLGNSDAVQVGQSVVAIGNPFGLDSTMTLGIVSSLGRTLDGDRAPGGGTFVAPDIIQTDAAINPGNSGGPLFNLNGEIIGVNKAIATETGVNSGIGFAVASNTVARIVPSLIENGRHEYAYLGLSGTDSERLTLAQIESLNLPDALGVYVVSVVPDGPASRAGLVGDSGGATGGQFVGDGDFIIEIDGLRVRTFADVLSYLVNNTEPGQQIVLTVIRGGETLEVPLVLGVRPTSQ